MLKKTFIFALVLLIGLVLTACGSKGDKNKDENADESTDATQEIFSGPTPYKLSYKDVDISLGKTFDPGKVDAKITTTEIPNEILEGGVSTLFAFDGLEIATMEIEDEELVYFITILKDTVTTKENIKVSDTVEQLVEAYGETFVEENGRYIYTKGDVELRFIIEDGHVAKIEYWWLDVL